jgi:hypothetical protein
MFVMCSFEGLEGQAVVTLRRRPFDGAALPAILSGDTTTALQFHNDIYAKVSTLLSATKVFFSLLFCCCSAKGNLLMLHDF